MLQSCNWSLVGTRLCLCVCVNKNEMKWNEVFYSNINYKAVFQLGGWVFNVAVSQREEFGLDSCLSFFLYVVYVFTPCSCVLPPTVYRHVKQVYWRDLIIQRYDYTSRLMAICCMLGYTQTQHNLEKEQADRENEWVMIFQWSPLCCLTICDVLTPRFGKPGLNDQHLSHSGRLYSIVRAVLLSFCCLHIALPLARRWASFAPKCKAPLH